MKTTPFLALALVALGMSAQSSPAPANAAITAGSVNTQGVDYRCFYKCVKDGHNDCHRRCYRPGPDRPTAVQPPAGTLQKRGVGCYYYCIKKCHPNDSACFDQCAWDCIGSGGDPPTKKE